MSAKWRWILTLLAVLALLSARPWLPFADSKSGYHASPASTVASDRDGNAVRRSPNGPAASDGRFDFYVLSLSWSPSYCAAEGGNADPQQCAAARPRAFIVHGLWPQYEQGYPSDCPTSHPHVQPRTVRALDDIMPSAGLIRHEWKTHGACTGLDQADYFRTLRAAREKISVPPQYRQVDRYRQLAPGEVEAAFLRANRRLPANGISVTCDRRFLRDVRICMTKDLEFRSCPQVDRRSCRSLKVMMPPVRGG